MVIKNISNIDFLSELSFQTARSGGPGGQNVNKVETKVFLKFDVLNSTFFDEIEKAHILKKCNSFVIENQFIQISCQESRSQIKNKEIAIKKFKTLLKNAFTVQKERKPSQVPVEIIKKRLKAKKINSELKSTRGKVEWH